MLTGLYPSLHGVVNPDEHDSALPKDTETLPDILRKNGYRTFGYSSHLRFSPAYGHAKGFERFLFNPTVYNGNYCVAINKTIQHLEAHQDESNFVLLHIFDTHPPFEPLSYLENLSMEKFRRNITDNQNDKAINEDGTDFIMDECLARLQAVDVTLHALYSYINRQSWKEQATIVLTTDHGPTQLQKGKPLLLDPSVSIPLFVKAPTIKPQICHSFIEGNVDLMPSILYITNIASPNNINGQPWPFLNGQERPQGFSESLYGNVYAACIRDQDFSYHFQYPFNYTTQNIYFDKEQSIVVYRREKGREVETPVEVDSITLNNIRSQITQKRLSAHPNNQTTTRVFEPLSI